MKYLLLLTLVLVAGCGGSWRGSPAPAYYGGFQDNDAVVIHGDLTQPNDFIFGF